MDKIKAIGKRQHNSKGTEPETVVRKLPGTSQKERRDAILKALAAGPLNSHDLASAVGAKHTERTFSRARLGLVKEGLVTVSPGDHRTKLYSLTEKSPAN